MRLGRDGIAGLIGLAVSLVLLPFAYGLPKLPIVPIGPGFYPTIVLVFMAAICALLVAQDAAAQRRPRAAGEISEQQPRPAYGLVLAAFLIVAAYVALLPQIGFRLATVLFVGAFQGAIERPSTLRAWIGLVIVAVLTSAVTYYVFDQYLSVLLPRGRWTGW
jgi:hypothetical protein